MKISGLIKSHTTIKYTQRYPSSQISKTLNWNKFVTFLMLLKLRKLNMEVSRILAWTMTPIHLTTYSGEVLTTIQTRQILPHNFFLIFDFRIKITFLCFW